MKSRGSSFLKLPYRGKVRAGTASECASSPSGGHWSTSQGAQLWWLLASEGPADSVRGTEKGVFNLEIQKGDYKEKGVKSPFPMALRVKLRPH